jgi:SAM-dependent methyltransferase
MHMRPPVPDSPVVSVSPPRSGSAFGAVPVAAVSAAVSAALLMSVQPLWSRLAMPQAGGSPAVWTVSLASFQALLLAGYAIAHGLAGQPRRLRQVGHLAILLAALSLQPFALRPDAALNTPLALLFALFATVGLPFVALAVSNTLLQAHLRDVAPDRDPYPLYAASNAGSLLGLLFQPFVADRLFGVHTQTLAWAGSLGLLLVLVALQYLRAGAGATQAVALVAEAEPVPRPQPVQVSRWLVWAALPTALLTALSTWLSTAVAAVPMLWVLPLALYLLTFVVSFVERRPSQVMLERAAALLVPPVVLLLATGANHPVELVVGLHLLGFFAVSLACHGRLSADRPPPQWLSLYWLVQAAGGAVGGAISALALPLLVPGAQEYPVLLGLTLLAGVVQPLQGRWWLVLAAVPPFAIVAAGLWLTGPALLIARAAAALSCFLLSRQRWPFALAVLGTLLASLIPPAGAPRPIAAARSFFGVHRVEERQDGVRELYHGVTLHGRQDLRQGPCVPLLYYYPTGPIGQVLQERPPPANARIGAVGLGIGSLACYAQPEQHWTFFEIDADVVGLARSAFGFPWGRPADVVLGDARLTLAAEPAASFDLLILDAYSADSIPLHLLTAEALDGYARQLKPGGLLLFHVSNRYFDLPPVLASWAGGRGWQARLRDDSAVPDRELALGKTESRWVAVGKTTADLGPLAADLRWQTVQPMSGPLWTDDRASALDVWRPL